MIVVVIVAATTEGLVAAKNVPAIAVVAHKTFKDSLTAAVA
tara:strand:+ start:3854 stop:3976 length:123 start_codon:yes stop_codon:yes gene_type:complete